MRVAALDHLVLTVATSMRPSPSTSGSACPRGVRGGPRRTPLRRQKINLHEAGSEFQPYARRPVPGSADLCFLVDDPLDEVARALAAAGVAIELGPVERTGAVGAIDSLYVRDPDGNLVELSRRRSS